jgi:hypothetical protein
MSTTTDIFYAHTETIGAVVYWPGIGPSWSMWLVWAKDNDAKI